MFTWVNANAEPRDGRSTAQQLRSATSAAGGDGTIDFIYRTTALA